MIFSSKSGRVRSLSRVAVPSALAVLLALSVVPTPADARMGGGSSFGSRGGRSFSMPPATTTAPRSAQPLPRAAAPYGGSGAFAPSTAQPRRFGFGSGVMAGLLGAGLFGLFTGGGFFGGVGGLESLFGLLLQAALLGGAALFLVRWLKARQGAPAMAASAYGAARTPAAGPIGGGASAPFAPSPTDFDAFERALVAIQTAYGREDAGALSRLVTPEVLARLGRDVEGNRRRGLRNEVTDPRLLQGDLAEAWREGAADYATVAMRFAARDVMVDRNSGSVVEGDPTRPSIATELWTFRRDRGGPWLLSAVQQAS